MSRSERLQHEITARLQRAMENSALTVAEQLQQCLESPDCPSLRHLHEQISAEAALLVVHGDGPTSLLQSLLHLQLAPLCPMAAEVHVCSLLETQRDEFTHRLVMQSPIFVHQKTLYAAPVGELDEPTLQQFCDRILKQVKDRKIKTVHLYMNSLTAPDNPSSRWQTLLKEELAALRIHLTIER
ncbi:MAG: hypothetical protein JXX29_05730 [Deltaproteobacteria bacterium]|nr:hypothetical protein [Deltaproteobacteria bacterium]MBN2671149.1 hypothetical protein [Deltaproteobacteria bacterium]